MNIVKITVMALSLVVTAVTAQDVRPRPLPLDHPLIGTWRIDLQNGCFEEYTLRADGTKLSRSGEERNESVFDISERPLASGFYRWTDKIIKGNGKPDCSGSATELGHVAIKFVLLHPNGSRFLLCDAENMQTCFAEFHRKRQSDI